MEGFFGDVVIGDDDFDLAGVWVNIGEIGEYRPGKVEEGLCSAWNRCVCGDSVMELADGIVWPLSGENNRIVVRHGVSVLGASSQVARKGRCGREVWAAAGR